MPDKVRIALDAMGGDHGASVVLPGADISLIRHPDIEYLLFGDRAVVEPLMDEAEALGVTKPRAAQRLWQQVDRKVTDLAVWLPLVNPLQVDLVSARVGNISWNPQSHLMPSLLWVE